MEYEKSRIKETSTDKPHKFLVQTIVKITGPKNDFIDKIIACLSVVFQCKPTSPVMYNHDFKQFFVYVSVAPKEA